MCVETRIPYDLTTPPGVRRNTHTHRLFAIVLLRESEEEMKEHESGVGGASLVPVNQISRSEALHNNKYVIEQEEDWSGILGDQRVGVRRNFV